MLPKSTSISSSAEADGAAGSLRAQQLPRPALTMTPDLQGVDPSLQLARSSSTSTAHLSFRGSRSRIRALKCIYRTNRKGHEGLRIKRQSSAVSVGGSRNVEGSGGTRSRARSWAKTDRWRGGAGEMPGCDAGGLGGRGREKIESDRAVDRDGVDWYGRESFGGQENPEGEGGEHVP